ncbi:MAG: NAD-dependent epimerase/dehydratase family protein [Bacteroidia bacterium]|nr:NAD-dependent epimerase/dehydratase family protein [Bacteroidia bacterium]
MSTRNILVTGGAGFIGSSMAEKLSKDPLNNIVITDNLLTGSLRKVPKSDNVTFLKANVNRFDEISDIFYTKGFDYVFHYAAMVGVQRTLSNPVSVLDDIHGLENILRLSKNTGVKHVYYASSSEVYGEPVEFPQNEQTTPLNSRLPYAIVKNVGEAYLRSYQQEYGLNYTIFRFFNTYGPKQSRDFVISKFIGLALKNEDITIYGDGSQTRTFCFVEDNVEACYNAFHKHMYINDVVNIGSNRETSILELAQIIIRLVGSSSRIVHLAPLKEGDMTRRLPDNAKMLQLLGRAPRELEKGLQEILDNPGFIL